MSFLREAFSENGIGSCSRLLMALHSLVACGALIFVVIKNHTLPDTLTLGGLGAFVSAPYAVNAARNVFQKVQNGGQQQ